MSVQKVFVVCAALCALTDPLHVHAQIQDCGTVLQGKTFKAMQREAEADGIASQVELAAQTFFIPVTFHVVRRSNGSGGINEAQLSQGILDANNIFANANMRFCQTGPVLYVDSDFYYQQANTTADIHNLWQIGRVPDTVNVYLLPFLTTEQGALCGLATFSDVSLGGIAMRYSCIGNGANGTSFAHELGHYFNLLHTHDGLQCTSNEGCRSTGDLVCDTPPDPGLGGFNVAQGCVYVGGQADPCGSSVPYTPMVSNIMSYAPPSCRNALTPGQLARARATLINQRPELALSACPTGGGPTADLMRISISSAGLASNGHSTRASCSADGRFIVFASQATNLDPQDTSPVADIYLRDRLNGTTELVSVSMSNGSADGACDRPSVSADGRYVVFESVAANLVTGIQRGIKQVYLRDRQLNHTRLISRTPAGPPGNSDSDRAVISKDGTVVAFCSSASDLVANDTNFSFDVFVAELATGQVQRISVTSEGEEGNSSSPGTFDAAIGMSADGRFVAFSSGASNLIANDINKSFEDVFVRDRLMGTTSLVGVNSAGEQGNFGSGRPTISANGRFVAFTSQSTNFGPDTNGFAPDVYVRDRQTGQTTLVSLDGQNQQFNAGADLGSISGDGRRVVFQRILSNSFPTSNDLYMRDLANGQVIRLNPSIDGLGSGTGTKFAMLSDNGNVVAYQSDAANLVLNDTNGRTDIFAYTLPGQPIAIGDINANGVVDIDDLIAVITNWGPCSSSTACPADVTGNGIVDIDDLLTVINHWG